MFGMRIFALYLRTLLTVSAVVFSFTLYADVDNLRCEYMRNPVGVDAVHPRLSWTLPELKDKIRVVISEDSLAVSAFRHGRTSDRSGHVRVYDLAPATQEFPVTGMKLEPARRYYWRVFVGKHSSVVASFVTNLPLGGARWITDGNDVAYRPLALYRNTVNVAKPVREAFITVASAGLHEIMLNGAKVGDHCLDPMFTRFDRRVLSVMHDVSGLIREGVNVVMVELGNGWYNHQSTAVWFFHEASWRNRPRFAANLLIRYTDGTEENVMTDGSWQTAESSTVFSSIYTAEHYDARTVRSESSWHGVKEVDSPTRIVSSQVMHPVRRTAVFRADEIDRLSDTLAVYHFPKNIAGVTRFRIRGPRGTVVRLKHGEMLYADGRVNLRNIDYHYRPTDDRDPFQTDIVTLSGGDDEFAARFGYKGFQYVEVSSSVPLELTAESLVAEEMHSDVPRTGYWHSSSEYLNKLLAATENSYLSNLFGYPTDCPQREKNGWTADAYLALETGMAYYDVVTIYEKWMADFRDEQRPDGTLPCIVPTDKWGYDWANGVDWTSAAVIIPWQIYCWYGDRQILERHYDCMDRYVRHIETVAKENLTDWGLGDWIPVKTKSDLCYTTSVYYYVDAVIMSEVARLLGKAGDASHYSRLADDIRSAINRRFLNPENGLYAGGTQTELSMALYWDVVPDELRAKTASRLNERVVADCFHLDVGVHGCKALLGALSDNGYADTAYRVVCQKTYPSWGYWISQGATTLHENWRTDVIIDNSLNHIMFGEVGAWLFKSLAGITPDERMPGFRLVNIRPYFPSDLDSLNVSRETPYGRLETFWKRDGGVIRYIVNVPAAMTARLLLPDGRRYIIRGESKTFKIKSK